MARLHSHYEAAFEDYLRSRGVPYVPVNEARKVIFSGNKVKSFDFLIYPGGAQQWIVDIKGRKFPYIGSNGSKRYWENWVLREDLEGLADWQEVFGDEFEAQFIFAYQLQGPPDRWPAGRPHCFNHNYYAFLAVARQDYERHCQVRSDKWETVSVPTRVFREIARPVESLTLWDA